MGRGGGQAETPSHTGCLHDPPMHPRHQRVPALRCLLAALQQHQGRPPLQLCSELHEDAQHLQGRRCRSPSGKGKGARRQGGAVRRQDVKWGHLEWGFSSSHPFPGVDFLCTVLVATQTHRSWAGRLGSRVGAAPTCPTHASHPPLSGAHRHTATLQSRVPHLDIPFMLFFFQLH